MKIDKGAIGFVIGTTLFGIVGTFCGNHYFAPKRIFSQHQDFNGDGFADVVIQQYRGYKIPMYGVLEGREIRYVTGKEMKKISPSLKVDYKKIESELNKKNLSQLFFPKK